MVTSRAFRPQKRPEIDVNFSPSSNHRCLRISSCDTISAISE